MVSLSFVYVLLHVTVGTSLQSIVKIAFELLPNQTISTLPRGEVWVEIIRDLGGHPIVYYKQVDRRTSIAEIEFAVAAEWW